MEEKFWTRYLEQGIVYGGLFKNIDRCEVRLQPVPDSQLKYFVILEMFL